jgi:dTMP kinase
MARPLFITFEGLDGSGKTTHLRRVAEELEAGGQRCVVTHEPGGTPLGEAVRRVFLDPRWGEVDGTVELLLVFASRRQHLIEVIDPALADGRHVLCDRFTDSTRAYQGAGRGVPRELIDRIDRVATGARVPDRTLLFDLPPEVARSRGASPGRATEPHERRLDEETLAFYRRARDGFLELARAEPGRFRVIDSSGTREETARQVRAALADLPDLVGDPARAGDRTAGAEEVGG